MGRAVTSKTQSGKPVVDLMFFVTREVKHDVYGKRQTAKIILILLTFSLALKSSRKIGKKSLNHSKCKQFP